MDEVIGHTWKGDLSHWNTEVEVSLPGELGVPCIQESWTQSGMSSQATKDPFAVDWLVEF